MISLIFKNAAHGFPIQNVPFTGIVMKKQGKLFAISNRLLGVQIKS